MFAGGVYSPPRVRSIINQMVHLFVECAIAYLTRCTRLSPNLCRLATFPVVFCLSGVNDLL